MKAARLMALAAALTAATAQAETIIGLHLHTVHFHSNAISPAQEPRDDTPGLYVRWSNGATAGVVRNSHGRWSAYAGHTSDWWGGRVQLTVGAITGYQYRRASGPDACPYSLPQPAYDCWTAVGHSAAVLRPLIAPSVRLPALSGVTPRVALLGKGIHLSIEGSF